MIDTTYLRKMAGLEQADAPAFEALIDAYDGFVTPRPIAEYHEDMGAVLWWKFPIEEPPYVGSPNHLGFSVGVEMIARTSEGGGRLIGGRSAVKSFSVGGWPGYHTHFTPIPIPREPKPCEPAASE